MKQSRSSSEGEARKVSVAEEGSFSEELELALDSERRSGLGGGEEAGGHTQPLGLIGSASSLHLEPKPASLSFPPVAPSSIC